MLSVTALIPTYNRARFLGDAIESLLGQSCAPNQLLVVDDGSRDNTREVVEKFGSSIEYIEKKNGGKSSALNVGLRHVRNDCVWILDDDDIAEQDALRKMLEALQEKPECGFAFGNYDLFTIDGNGRQYRTLIDFPEVNPDDLYLALMERCFILQGALLVRKACFTEVGDFDEGNTRSEDLDMMLRLAQRFRGAKVDAVMFHQRQHSGVRGPGSAPVAANHMVEGWIQSDRQMFDRIYQTHQLRDFLPKERACAVLTDEETITALAQRACIMARKGLWTYAVQDLQQIRDMAYKSRKTRLHGEQTAILRRILDLFSYAPHTFEHAVGLPQVLNSIRPLGLQRDIRAAVLWPLPFTIGAAYLHGHQSNFRSFLKAYYSLVTPHVLARTLLDSSFLNAGLELLRKRRSQKSLPNLPQMQKNGAEYVQRSVVGN